MESMGPVMGTAFRELDLRSGWMTKIGNRRTCRRQARYCSSLTFSIQATALPFNDS
jgi:hypothetical protein